MKQCKRCISDENFPGIEFDDDSICNFCKNHRTINESNYLKERYENKFIGLLNTFKGKHIYDCVVAYSGGKDSTYLLSILKEKYDLNILAVRYDNWFQSEASIKNIDKIVKHLNIDLITIKPQYETFRKIMKTVIEHDFYSIKNKQRASDICTTCISLIRFQCFKIALEKEIPFIIFGMSPGQAPIVTSVVKTNSQMIQQMQEIIYRPLQEHIGDEIKPFFLEERHFQKDMFPYSINPLSFLDYNEPDIIKKIQLLGWVNPTDTDPNSTNCILNALANHIHMKKYGFHAYCYELSELIREGKISREDALKKVSVNEDKHLINVLYKKFGIS
jgi:queuosine biosynthesis protein QueC